MGLRALMLRLYDVGLEEEAEKAEELKFKDELRS